MFPGLKQLAYSQGHLAIVAMVDWKYGSADFQV